MLTNTSSTPPASQKPTDGSFAFLVMNPSFNQSIFPRLSLMVILAQPQLSFLEHCPSIKLLNHGPDQDLPAQDSRLYPPASLSTTTAASDWCPSSLSFHLNLTGKYSPLQNLVAVLCTKDGAHIHSPGDVFVQFYSLSMEPSLCCRLPATHAVVDVNGKMWAP